MLSDSVEHTHIEASVSSVGSCAPEEKLSQLLGPLEEGETHTRQILQSQWFRAFSALKDKSNLEQSALAMLQKHMTSAETPNEDEEKQQQEWMDGDKHRGSLSVAEKFAQDRKRGEFIYEEQKQRGELEWEEFADISQLQLFMEEDMWRVSHMDESMSTLQLVHSVMKPKAQRRYNYAWGIAMTVAAPPQWSEAERIRCSQRHKPPQMRLPPLTCRIPIEPNPFWKPWKPPAPTVGLIEARPEM